MVLLDIDLSNTPTEIEPFPAGVYNLRIVSAELGTTKSGDNPLLRLKMVVDDEGEYKGRTVLDNISFTHEFGEVRLKQLCVSAGVETGNGLETEDLVDRILRAQVVVDTYKDPSSGETRKNNKISKYVH